MAQKLVKAGVQTQGGLACPNCGGTSFRPHRSLKGKLVLGLLAPKSRVECVACGKEFKR